MVFYFRDGGPEKFSQSHRNGESGGSIVLMHMIANVLKDNFFGDLNQVYFHQRFSPLLHELTTLRAEATFLLCELACEK